MKQKMRALDARPIKKVAEAKYRKQLRAQRRLEKAAKKSEGLVDQEDLSERAKLEQAEKLMNKAKKGAKTEKNKVKVVVAKHTNRAIKGRPRGVKGRYKVLSFDVDGGWSYEERS
jgi:AdoMet-dependent rRNA methyltransferase SPB1